jgi:hypothetical protein
MPFTLAHPAAAVPLRRALGRFGVLSALAIGSLTPDLAYFLPLGIGRRASHSLAGLFWFCLPVGLAAYGVFHCVLKRPLASLLPERAQRGLAPLLARSPGLPAAPWSAVVVSLLAGAVSHLLWDLLTHEGAAEVRSWPPLRSLVVSLRSDPHLVYRVLQHGSTLLGFALIAHWSLRWLRGAADAPPLAAPLGPVLPRGTRTLLLAALLGGSALVGSLVAGPPIAANGLSFESLRVFAGRAVIHSLSVLGGALLAFSVAWHVIRGGSPRGPAAA